MAEELLKTEFDAAHLIFNRFKSAISYKPTLATVLSPDVSCLLQLCLPQSPVWRAPASLSERHMQFAHPSLVQPIAQRPGGGLHT